MKRLFLLLSAAAFSTAAIAQLRTIPKDAELGLIRHLESMVVEIDGKPRELAAGAQIRDADNRIVVPAALIERSQARYLIDGTGMVRRVWILSEREKAELPPSRFPK
jgi:hypothetical protein